MSVPPPLLQALTWSASISSIFQILFLLATCPIAQRGQLKMINSRFERGSNSFILAFILANIYVAYNPTLNKTFVQKRFDIINKPENKGGLPLSFFESIFDVNEFIEE